MAALLQRTADAIDEVLHFPNVDIPRIDPQDRSTLVLRIRGGDYMGKIPARIDCLSIGHDGRGPADAHDPADQQRTQ